MTERRIFVSIANYRDGEGPATIADLFAKAAHPERVFAGVLWQVVPGEDEDCTGAPAPDGHLRGITVHARDSLGACWARHRILAELLEDEAFVLQIDSHMRFAPGWDCAVLDMLAGCPSARPVLSTHPVGYRPPATLGAACMPVLTADRFSERGVLKFKAKALPLPPPGSVPPPNGFIGAACLFAPSQAFREVPYDPHLYFHGEEVTMAARLWTHGWDIFTPTEPLVYHDYSDARARPRHWSDNRDWATLDRRAAARVRHLLGSQASSDPQVLTDLAAFGLGQRRTLAAYEQYADVDFQACAIGPRAKAGHFPSARGDAPPPL